MTAPKFAVATRDNWVNQLNTDLGSSGLLKLYSGARAASVATSPAGTLLSTNALAATAMGASSSGVGTFNAITNAAAAAAGTAAWGRLCKSDGTGVMDIDVGVDGIVMVSAVISAIGQPVAISSLTVTAPGA